MVISIHAPRTGSDKGTIQARLNTIISIHAPRTGSDVSRYSRLRRCAISIHAPRTGSDSGSKCGRSIAAVFQSTLPARGATAAANAADQSPPYFNPRSPHGERLARRSYKGFSPDISIHAPRTGSDLPFLSDNKCHHLISIHAPRTGSDRGGAHLSAWGEYFNPRSPHGERRASSRFCYSYL